MKKNSMCCLQLRYGNENLASLAKTMSTKSSRALKYLQLLAKDVLSTTDEPGTKLPADKDDASEQKGPKGRRGTVKVSYCFIEPMICSLRVLNCRLWRVQGLWSREAHIYPSNIFFRTFCIFFSRLSRTWWQLKLSRQSIIWSHQVCFLLTSLHVFMFCCMFLLNQGRKRKRLDSENPEDEDFVPDVKEEADEMEDNSEGNEESDDDSDFGPRTRNPAAFHVHKYYVRRLVLFMNSSNKELCTSFLLLLSFSNDLNHSKVLRCFSPADTFKWQIS